MSKLTREGRLEVMRQFVDKYCFPTLERKGKDYDGEKRGDHFEWAVIPERGVDRYVVLWVHLSKQLFALFTWMRTRELASEPLESRIKDIINYCLILVSMLVEDGVIKLDLLDVPTCFGCARLRMLDVKEPDEWEWTDGKWLCPDCFDGSRDDPG